MGETQCLVRTVEVRTSHTVVVVIGIGGMGQAIARRLGPGQHLLLADFNEQVLTGYADELRGVGFTVTTRTVDVSRRESVAALADAAAELGPVTHVVHTAGLSPTQAPPAAVLRVDLLGTALVLEEFARVVAPGGAGVAIASMAGHFAIGSLPAELERDLAITPAEDLLDLPALAPEQITDAGAAYSISKRGNVLRVQAAAGAWGARGARINSISPGVIATPMGQQELAGESGDRMRSMVAMSGSGRLGTAEDIAHAAVFLLDPQTSFVTGTDLLVDGGTVAAVRRHALG